jgi:hypothetical protein
MPLPMPDEKAEREVDEAGLDWGTNPVRIRPRPKVMAPATVAVLAPNFESSFPPMIAPTGQNVSMVVPTFAIAEVSQP